MDVVIAEDPSHRTTGQDAQGPPTNSTSQAQPCEEYEYHPLDSSKDEIRVLKVYAGHGEELIRTSLRTVSLHCPPTYETISYVWGDASVRSSILIDGKALNVPASAERAIRRMRKSSSRILWIDAVCINQNDLQEREQQVSIMGQVYRKTAQNLVWLGPRQQTTAAAVEAMEAMWCDMFLETGGLQALHQPLTVWEQNGYSKSYNFCPHNVAALLNFYSNPWFRRLWCVQEVALPSTSVAICGEFELPLLKVLRVAQWIFYKRTFLGVTNPEDPHNSSVSHIDMVMRNPQMLFELVDQYFSPSLRINPADRKQSFFQFLYVARHFDTSDPRDRIFGILGLVSQAQAPQDNWAGRFVQPDYRKSFVHVARDATKAVIGESGALHVLSLVYNHDITEHEGVKFPSWVPRLHLEWDYRVDASILLRRNFAAYPSAESARGTVVCSLLSLPADDDLLYLRGIMVDHVTEVTEIFAPSSSYEIDAIVSPIARRSISEVINLSDAEQARSRAAGLARVLIAADEHHDSRETLEIFFEWALAIIGRPAGFAQSLAASDETLEKSLVKLKHYQESVMIYCTNRRIFFTANGYIGLGPREMMGTDVVAVVRGHDVPIILRSEGEVTAEVCRNKEDFVSGGRRTRPNGASGEYSFIGDAYVDGIMYGEAVHAHRQRNGCETLFKVR